MIYMQYVDISPLITILVVPSLDGIYYNAVHYRTILYTVLCDIVLRTRVGIGIS